MCVQVGVRTYTYVLIMSEEHKKHVQEQYCACAHMCMRVDR